MSGFIAHCKEGEHTVGNRRVPLLREIYRIGARISYLGGRFIKVERCSELGTAGKQG